MKLLPLSVPQKEIWTEWLAWSNSAHLNIGGYTEITGVLDTGLFEKALQLLVQENSALRLIPNIKGSQASRDDVIPIYEFVDLSHCEDPKQAIMEWQEQWMEREFDFKNAPPVRFALLKEHDRRHYLVIQAMHTIMDGWSLSLTTQKLGDCYNRLMTKTVNSLVPQADYLDFIEASNEYLQSNTYKKDHEYWIHAFSKLPEPLFTERYGNIEKKATELPKAYIAKHHIDETLRVKIATFCRDNKATAFQVYLAVLSIYIFKSQNVSEVVIGVPSLNRGGNKYKNTLGMFVAVLPLTIYHNDGQSFNELVADIGRSLKKSYRHAKYPLSDHAKRLEVVRRGRDRLFDIIFSYEEFEFSSQFGDAVLSETKQTFNPYSRYPLAISLCDFLDAKDTEMVLETGSTFFSEAESQLIGPRIISLASQLIGEQRVNGNLQLCTEAEVDIQQKQYDRNRTLIDTESFSENIINTSLVTPKNIALISDEVTLNYQQLVICAAHLADQLHVAGVEPGDTVVLALHRGPEVVVAMLACSFIGAIFLPIDLEWPDTRIQNITEQTRCNTYFVNSSSTRFFSGTTLPVDITDLCSKPYQLSELVKYNKVNHKHAYTLFTSGTTGHPKGVVVSHKALKNRLNWIVDNWGLTSDDRALQATQINFDPSLIEMLAPLMAGGSVAFPKAGRLLPEWLPELITHFNATMMAFVPSTLTRFLDGLDSQVDLPLRICCCGGEVLSYELAKRFSEATGAQLFNVYGPTEATIFCTSWQMHPQTLRSRHMPIGKAISNTQIIILNDQDQLQPFGVVGEIYIAGESLAEGYVNNETETQHRFRMLETPILGHQRLYKTGDLGWLDCDGVLHFSGRVDRQIKLRGYRIELNEIENAILSIYGVEQAACKLVSDKSSSAIHAWYSSKSLLSNAEVRAKLVATLPDYMLPQRLMLIESMPVTSNEKIAYDELPPINLTEHLTASREPIGNLEKQMLLIWQRVLNRDSLTVNSHFFECGGDSLAAVIMLNDVEHLITQKLSLHQLVANPTVASLVECINSQLDKPSLLVSLGDTTRSASLFVAASGNGDLLRFKSLALCMKGVSDLHMLQPPGSVETLSIDELASLYADKIAGRGDKAIYLAGFSVGGLVAVETARKLRLRGMDVKTVFIVDTILMKMPQLFIIIWQWLAKLLARWHIARQRTSGSKILSVLQDKGLLLQVKAMRKHTMSNYDGDAILIKSSAYRLIHNLLLGGWRKVLIGRRDEVEIETSHSHFFEPGKVDQLADVIKAEINKKDGR
ncbi:non-ribosomal peptide synthetase [Psychrosphaera aestuarii]|uniref:non-ribosomal peptide synthetase n=1 Tax=Psychrosphaera aestuarii TaxID=1266052 RepID=UPI001B3192F6|nr:non-ribosomal peptide synthetase [Psychrosphaera aestuarii]